MPGRMRLLIVESPNKAKKLQEILGPPWRVAASFGHVRDLPPSGDLAVRFIDGRVEPTYVPLERSRDALERLRRLVAEAEDVVLASDPDREGEAIAWHLAELLALQEPRRAAFHAITPAAVRAALASPRAIDRHLVDAQQARRVLDRVVGWTVSPTLRRCQAPALPAPVAKKRGRKPKNPVAASAAPAAEAPRARSAGRVQSVALRLVAEREREIQAFDQVEHFIPWATLQKPGSPPPFRARCVLWKGAELATRLRDRAIAERAADWCKRQPWQVAACDRRELRKQPPPPFSTATCQQAASLRLQLAPEATMQALQALFEAGHITYHRTDSVALAPEAIAAARAIIAKDFPPAYLPAQAIVHATRAANAQEAHEAIRPTHPESGPDAVAGDHAGLYRLIWERFVACQMAPGLDRHAQIDVACAPGAWEGGPVGIFRARGRTVLFDGWRRLSADATEETVQRKRGRPRKGAAAAEEDEAEPEAELPVLEPGQVLDCLAVEAKETRTKPPPRYTQASLIKALEREGIGRPSTYANILAVLFARTYIAEDDRKLLATPLGLVVVDFLIRHYAGGFIDLDYTRRMEESLDRIARGEQEWQATITQATEHLIGQARKAGLWYDPREARPQA